MFWESLVFPKGSRSSIDAKSAGGRAEKYQVPGGCAWSILTQLLMTPRACVCNLTIPLERPPGLWESCLLCKGQSGVATTLVHTVAISVLSVPVP